MRPAVIGLCLNRFLTAAPPPLHIAMAELSSEQLVDTVATVVAAVLPVVPTVATPNHRHTHSTLGWK